MRVEQIIGRAEKLSINLVAVGDRIQIRPGSAAPPDFIEDVRLNKPGVLQYLRELSTLEAKEVEQHVKEHGVCLTWCSVVEDFVAFVATDDDAKSVPPGFTVYTERELFLLFNDGEAEWTPDGLRRIHAHKRAGLDIADLPAGRADSEGS